MSVPAQLRAALGILIVLLVAILAAAFYVPYRLNASANEKYVQDAIPLRSLVDDLVLQVARQQADAQASVAGYRGQMTEYRRAQARANADLTAMTPHVAKHPSLETLRRLAVVQILNVQVALQTAIQTATGSGRAQSSGLFDETNNAFDELRNTALRMQRETDAFVAAARRDQNSTYRSLLVTLGVLGGIALAIAITLLLVTPRRLGQLYVGEERARRQAESRAEAARALAHVADGVVLADPRGMVRFHNPAAARLLEVSDGRLVGRRLDDFVPAWAEIARRNETGGGGAAIVPVEQARGERWLSVVSVEFDEGAVYALRDVSEERALERMRSDFVATASHELRTPMTSIYGAARTLLRDDIELSPERRRTFLEMISTESDRLSRIVDDILLASRLDAGGVRVASLRCDPGELTRSVVDAARIRAPSNIRLRLDAPPDVPDIAADPDRLRQVLVNILDNAIKYSPHGGDVDVSIDPSDGQVRFVVRDNGLGFPPSEQERIFERFHRLDPEQTHGIGGTGLGLYICRELVERMDGRIWAESHPGDGSAFFVELPQAADE
jgi:two-component system phosphate regulon sensor histidine kinase PhoR